MGIDYVLMLTYTNRTNNELNLLMVLNLLLRYLKDNKPYTISSKMLKTYQKRSVVSFTLYNMMYYVEIVRPETVLACLHVI